MSEEKAELAETPKRKGRVSKTEAEEQEIKPQIEEMQEPVPQPPAERQAPSDNDRLMAMLCYLTQLILPFILPFIVLLSEENRKRDFQRYHAVHALSLAVLAIVYEVLAGLFFCVVSVIVPPLACILWTIFLLPLVPFIYYAYTAYQGQYTVIPWLTDFLVSSKWL
ncbi:MAG: DUF4870 domain-containing protein [Chloroflexi bacterium]|nr:DUF4870 domain-containing protein [Chloroflexota bacterium]